MPGNWLWLSGEQTSLDLKTYHYPPASNHTHPFLPAPGPFQCKWMQAVIRLPKTVSLLSLLAESRGLNCYPPLPHDWLQEAVTERGITCQREGPLLPTMPRKCTCPQAESSPFHHDRPILSSAPHKWRSSHHSTSNDLFFPRCPTSGSAGRILTSPPPSDDLFFSRCLTSGVDRQKPHHSTSKDLFSAWCPTALRGVDRRLPREAKVAVVSIPAHEGV